MRKVIVAIVLVGLVGAVMAAPAGAAKKKKKVKKGSFAAENLPFPSPNGCLDSVEGVHKTTEALKIPFSGVLTVTMESFDGDWDLFVTDADGGELGSATSSQLTGDPPSEEVVLAVKAKQEVAMVACNWAGGPSAEVNWQVAGK